MPPSAPTVGVATRLGFGTANPVTQEVEFTSFGLSAKPSQITTEGIRGTRSRPSETVAPGIIKLEGRYEVTPTPSQLAFLLKYVLGGTPTGSTPVTYPLAETLPTGLYCTVDRVEKVYTYTNVIFARTEITSREGDDNTLKMAFDLMATSETEAAAGTFPTISATLPTDQPFTHYGSVLTANSAARNVFDVTTVIDNHAEARYMNSQTPQNYRFLDRTITVNATLPFTADEHDLFVQALVPGVAGSLVYTNPDGTHVLTLSFAALQAAIPTPEIRGRMEVQMPVPFVARSVGTGPTTRELVVTM